MLKKFIIFSLMLVSALTIMAAPALALDTGLNQVGEGIELGNADPRTMVAQIINMALGFLGIIAVVIILLGGFKWMTAGGDEGKVEESKKLLAAGVIGLIIILAAWGIANYVVGALVQTTTGTV